MNTETSSFAPEARRVNYRNGILLAASDFQQEQLYHRGRLAAALARLHGFGTIAGLKVERFAAGTIRAEDGQARTDEELVVNPGIGLDRLGRIIEVPKKYCLRLQKWVEAQTGSASASFTAFEDAPNRYLVADVFLRFVECPNGLRPGFPEPAADATDAVVAARTTEGFELSLVARDCDPKTELPDVPVARFEAKPANHRDLLDQIYASYQNPTPEEYPVEFEDRSGVFLSRVLIRITDAPATDLARHETGEVEIEDERRPVVLPADLLATLLPMS